MEVERIGLKVDTVRRMVHGALKIGQVYKIDRRKYGAVDKRKEEDTEMPWHKKVVYMECVEIHRHHTVLRSASGHLECFTNMDLYKVLFT